MPIDFSSPPLSALRTSALHNDEHAARKFWHFLLSKYIFADRKTWVVAAEPPPAAHQHHHTQPRVDLTVEKFRKGRGTLTLVLTGEGTKAHASWDELAQLEARACAACAEYVPTLGADGQDRVWAVTFFGCAARIWACDVSAGTLASYYPPFGDEAYYKDIKRSLDGFLAAFDYIKRHPVPSAGIFKAKPPIDYEDSAEAAGQAAWAGSPPDIDSRPTSVVTNAIDTEQSTFLTVRDITALHVKGRREDGETVYSPAPENWQAARAFVPHENAYYPCFTATAASGTRYWTWALDGAKDKGRRRR